MFTDHGAWLTMVAEKLARVFGRDSVRPKFCSAVVTLLKQSVRTGFCSARILLGRCHSARAECSDGILFGQNSARLLSLYSGRVFGRDSVRPRCHSARAECSDGILLGQILGTLHEVKLELPIHNYHYLQLPIHSNLQLLNHRTLCLEKNALGDVMDQADDKANPKPWYTADEKSGKMSTEDLQNLIREYPLPEGWYARLPGLQEPANYGTKFETGVYEEQVKSGYRLPLHPFALRFFEHYRMAPGQLVPNGWRKLAGLIYLVQTSGYKPDATDFMRVFFEICFVKGVANCPGWCYIHSRQRLLKGGPKSNKGWHSRYFFIDRLDKGELPFDRDWNPFCKDFKNPGKRTPNNQTKHILSHIKLRGSLSIDEPLSEEQLEWVKIIPQKPIPAGLSIPHPPPAIPSMSSAETVPLGEATKCGVAPAPKKVRVTPPERYPRILDQVSIEDDPIFRPRWTLRRDDLGMPDSQMYASGSEMLSRFEMARQVAAEEAQQKRNAIKEAQEATHRAEELSKREEDYLAKIATLEKRLERVKRKAAEEVTKAREQGIRDFLDGNVGDEWLKKWTEDSLEIYELGFTKAKEMFGERFPDIPLEDFVLPAVASPSRETAMPSEARDAAASHPPGEGPSGDAPEP
ncbi:hypothetical protein RJ639_035382 [Escallonia herrerae]|uniref:Transposase (putative) gypsy type domain-containing protein n=1 Tax=Escallonia herrerae TaxID=1293975 RepID=A0AA88WQN1_9ASTE|nr:hypothetical protein RJ639_035382 [Escallonia herrerae]